MRRPPPVPTAELKKQFPGEHSSWKSMMKRVRDGKAECADEFRDFRTFLQHLGPMPDPSCTIDRKERLRGYEPSNVRWATKAQQANNRSNTVFLTYDGSELPEQVGECRALTEWAEITATPASTLRRRRSEGWSDTEVIDGFRGARAKSFAQMTEIELVNYKPWPEETKEEDERLYLRNREKGESRFAFERRVLIPRWQARIDNAAPNTMQRIATMPEKERDYWEDTGSEVEAGWILLKGGNPDDLRRIAKRQSNLDAYLRENLGEEKRWLAALVPHEDRTLAAKAAADLRGTYLRRRTPRVGNDTDD